MWGVPSVEWAVGRSVKCWKRDGACNFKLKIGDMRHGEVRRIRWAQLKKGGGVGRFVAATSNLIVFFFYFLGF